MYGGCSPSSPSEAAGTASRHVPVLDARSGSGCPGCSGQRQSAVSTEHRQASWQSRGNLAQICCTCPRSLWCSSEHCCQPHVPLMASRATYLVHGWRDSPPNALYSPLCRLLQQMTRSQQMDELLDVLIESGGTHCFSVPSRASPPSGIGLWGPELSVCPSGAACAACSFHLLPYGRSH